MSASRQTTPTKPLTMAQRQAAAFAHASDVLGLDDAKRLAAALAEVVVEELTHNAAFTARVRERYEALAPRKPAPATPRAKAPRAPKALESATPRAPKGEEQLPELVPIRRIEGREISLAGPLDPYFLQELYGDAQLARALDRYPLRKLQEAASLVEERHRGTRPAMRTDKEVLIAYIVAQLVTTEH